MGPPHLDLYMFHNFIARGAQPSLRSLTSIELFLLPQCVCREEGIHRLFRRKDALKGDSDKGPYLNSYAKPDGGHSTGRYCHYTCSINTCSVLHALETRRTIDGLCHTPHASSGRRRSLPRSGRSCWVAVCSLSIHALYLVNNNSLFYIRPLCLLYHGVHHYMKSEDPHVPCIRIPPILTKYCL